MDFVYRPEVPGRHHRIRRIHLARQGVKEILEKQGSELAKSQIVFPTDEFTRNCTGQNTPPELDRVNEAWQNVLRYARLSRR